MKNIFKKLKIYFTRLFAALRGKEIEKIVVEKVYGQKRKELDDFQLERIKEIMDMDEIKTPMDEKLVQEGFIENRKAYNKYKEWYWKLVGFNKPPEDLKKLIDADLKMDRVEMNRVYLKLLDKTEPDHLIRHDNKIEISTEFTNALKSGKEVTPEMENELHESIDNTISKINYKKGIDSKSLKELLGKNKKKLDKMVSLDIDKTKLPESIIKIMREQSKEN